MQCNKAALDLMNLFLPASIQHTPQNSPGNGAQLVTPKLAAMATPFPDLQKETKVQVNVRDSSDCQTVPQVMNYFLLPLSKLESNRF